MTSPTGQFDTQLEKTFRASRYAERMCTAHPDLIDRLRETGGEVLSADRLSALLAAKAGGSDEAAFHASLRALRRYAMVHGIFRDINGLANLAEVVETVTTLADVTLAAAQRFHTRATAERFGLAVEGNPLAQLLVVGMGKLGGRELNVSSDIDLIFVHAEDGDATAQKSWHEFHNDLGKRLIRALDHVDENGFVFRVDMRLRPFGASGPLVTSLASLENYFITQARPWERYAWLKARALTGAESTTSSLDSLVKPFVYRRYNDYAAIEEMRELHGQIRSDATKRNRLDDIKVGVGGIREVEFVAQLFQLVRGGRETALQTRSTRKALTQLADSRILPPERVATLQSAYAFLRNLEHRLQYLDDQQTQLLPSGDEDRQRIAEAMNFADWGVFLAALDQHRGNVTREFEALFAGAATTAPASAALPTGSGLATHVRSIAAQVNEELSATIGKRVDAWLASSRTQTLSAKSRARMEALIPFALIAALKQDPTEKTFFRLFDLIEAIDKRETYLALLVEYPQVLERVARLAANSAWAADFIRRHPILLDELIAPPTDGAVIDWRIERRTLQMACDAAAGDVEKQYELLRHAKQVVTLKLNIADIEGRLGVMALSDELSLLADMLLDTALVLAWRALNPAQSQAGNWQPPAGYAVIGYGKLGSKELGYASDLDLVFLFDPATGIEAERCAKLTQRLNSWLNTMTAGGVLYETDLRLRPDGDAGLLVSSLEAFRDYQLKRAWTWEHQALTRARFCAGDAALAAPFEEIRRDVLCQARDRKKLRDEIVAMRDKMRADKKDRADAIDLKHTRGGIVDVEFIVQYLILAYSHEHPEFLGNLGNFALLSRAAALGIIDEELAAGVGKAYLAYRERQHRARNNNELKTWVGLDELAEERQAVTRVWKALLG
ncbi:MAG: bifunctional [glutamate--ammonia ligase]-adenylyl-L-tyrosine phosphorylase/[glutamate--ammonia-ligase] adenylyltransferase [Betaproteobacteria bacterium]|nr:bifunctional [glutamate--ammonia ligase]-adenylyl-L-tyrosine phosphorylase/[glutamate--ammonia-ligase] adenylyltransferase [Betaproteobacteria bacterium]